MRFPLSLAAVLAAALTAALAGCADDDGESINPREADSASPTPAAEPTTATPAPTAPRRYAVTPSP